MISRKHLVRLWLYISWLSPFQEVVQILWQVRGATLFEYVVTNTEGMTLAFLREFVLRVKAHGVEDYVSELKTMRMTAPPRA